MAGQGIVRVVFDHGRFPGVTTTADRLGIIGVGRSGDEIDMGQGTINRIGVAAMTLRAAELVVGVWRYRVTGKAALPRTGSVRFGACLLLGGGGYIYATENYEGNTDGGTM